MSDKNESIDNERRCKRCGSKQTYIKFKDEIRVCRQCGFTEKINLEEIGDG